MSNQFENILHYNTKQYIIVVACNVDVIKTSVCILIKFHT